MTTINDKIFQENLLLTKTYCEMQLANTDKSAAEILRSFNPVFNEENVFTFKAGEYVGKRTECNQVVWSVDPWLDVTNSIYQLLFDQQLRHKKEVITQIVTHIDAKGKILISEVDWTTIDGCSEANSKGLIDIFDCPPIDTWFYLTENGDSRLMFCWIPQSFVNLIDIAVAVNATDCLKWY